MREDVRIQTKDEYGYFSSTEPQTGALLRLRRKIELVNRGEQGEVRQYAGSWEPVPEGEMPALEEAIS